MYGFSHTFCNDIMILWNSAQEKTRSSSLMRTSSGRLPRHFAPVGWSRPQLIPYGARTSPLTRPLPGAGESSEDPSTMPGPLSCRITSGSPSHSCPHFCFRFCFRFRFHSWISDWDCWSNESSMFPQRRCRVHAVFHEGTKGWLQEPHKPSGSELPWSGQTASHVLQLWGKWACFPIFPSPVEAEAVFRTSSDRKTCCDRFMLPHFACRLLPRNPPARKLSEWVGRPRNADHFVVVLQLSQN